MELNDAIRAFVKQKGWAAADATDDQIRAALSAKLVSGEITAEQWAELRKGKAPDPRQIIAGIVDERLGAFEARLLAAVGKAPAAPANPPAPAAATPPPAQPGGTAATPPAAGQGNPQQPPAGQSGGTPGPSEVDKAVAGALAKLGVVVAGGDGGDTRLSPNQLVSRAAQAGYLKDPNSIRVKSPVERYSSAKSEARWGLDSKHVSLRGKRVTFPSEEGPGMGRPLDQPSPADKAVIGAWFRWCLHSRGYNDLPPRYRMSDHDWELVKYALHELPWTGMVGGEEGTGVDGEKLAGVFHKGETALKALLDDSTSGGIYAAPQVVEDAIILRPLLYGELFPYVTVVNINRGRRFTQPTMGTPTFTSGTPEGTAIALFDTTNFIGSLDTNVYTAVGAMELGLDLEEDSPANLGAAIIARYGEAAQQWLDRVTALGDGVTEPKGIFLTTGVTTVASANGPAGPLTMADAEALHFGVNKEFRVSRGGQNVFVGNEVAYRRFRAIPTAVGYNTRAMGGALGDYTVMDFPYRIVPSVPNNWVSFLNLGYYRMIRRLGLSVKIETGGKELSLKNLQLIVVRMRYGGQVEQGGAVALMTDAPT